MDFKYREEKLKLSFLGIKIHFDRYRTEHLLICQLKIEPEILYKIVEN